MSDPFNSWPAFFELASHFPIIPIIPIKLITLEMKRPCGFSGYVIATGTNRLPTRGKFNGNTGSAIPEPVQNGGRARNRVIPSPTAAD